MAGVALGSNLGEPAATLHRAAGRMDGIIPGVRLAALSRLWLTAPRELERPEVHPLPGVLRFSGVSGTPAPADALRTGGPSQDAARTASGKGGQGRREPSSVACGAQPASPWYANMAARLECAPGVTPERLFSALMALEAALGRNRILERRWGPRVIDIDLIFFGEETRDTPELTLPHPRWSQRAFVALPLAEVAPDFVPTEIAQRLSFCAYGTMVF